MLKLAKNCVDWCAVHELKGRQKRNLLTRNILIIRLILLAQNALNGVKKTKYKILINKGIFVIILLAVKLNSSLGWIYFNIIDDICLGKRLICKL